jgi:hypothetical protein
MEEFDREWQDGDDTALVDQGYEEAIMYVQNTITKVLENPQIDIMPASMALRVLAASLNLHLTNEED